ncbi:hypothetical protein SAMN04515674_10945 [Pseudarcicella hirudinis]|uniref:Chaperone of endosialidase n=1 Tax=Pseudarcicella hirudinis TaxID=1079859 RepID=A0A1I5VCV8_9BACT|nr:bZIP transcription factor [Pseudarcicella hirudinis]SFQ05353.1 hypothetical protein SAMN04515674_10945 [Pseudarcicella hirudinis]
MKRVLQALSMSLLSIISVQNVKGQTTYYGTGANQTGSNNANFGYNSGYSNTTGSQNTNLGYQAGYYNQTASQNTFTGYQAGVYSTGGSNSFTGAFSGNKTTTGYYNTAIGASSLRDNTTGLYNTALGGSAGLSINGNDNTLVGGESGKFIADGSTSLTSGTGLTLIGRKASAGVGGLTNATAIGYNALVGTSNSLVLGGIGSFGVNVGIGTTSPTAKLEITTGTTGSAGLKFTNLTSASTTVTSNGKALSVDASGNVVLVPITATSSYWGDAGNNNIINSNTGGVIIGTGITSFPATYKLYVAGGILTEALTIGAKNTSNWSDFVFARNYKLRSLIEVEKFIKQNGHLPEIVSAEEVVKNGIKVGEIESKLLQKVEELTLYIIAQEKRIKSLEKRTIKYKH